MHVYVSVKKAGKDAFTQKIRFKQNLCYQNLGLSEGVNNKHIDKILYLLCYDPKKGLIIQKVQCIHSYSIMHFSSFS